MNKIIIIIGIIVLVIGGSYLFLNHENNAPIDKTSEEYISGHCDKLLHKNVRWAVCYKKDKIIDTVQRGNIYEATKTRKYDYDKVEVFNKVGGSIVVATYEGKLYFDVHSHCK